MEVICRCQLCGFRWDGHWHHNEDYLNPTCPKCGAVNAAGARRLIFMELDEDFSPDQNEKEKTECF